MTTARVHIPGRVTLIIRCYECRQTWVELCPGETDDDARAYLRRMGGGCPYCGYVVVTTQVVEEFTRVTDGEREPQALRLPAIGQECQVGYPRVLTDSGEPRPLQVRDRVSDNGDGTYSHTLEFAWPRLVRDEEPS